VTVAAAAYVALMAWGVTMLPGHMQFADLLFPIVLALALPAASWTWRRLDVFLLLFVAASALSVPGSIAPRQAGLDVVKEVYLFASYLALAWAMTRAGVHRIVRWLPISVAATAALSLAAAVVFAPTGVAWTVFGQPMPLPYIGTVFRLTGTLETPEFFGNLLTLALPLAIVCRALAADRRPWTVAVGAMAVAEALTFSKSLGGCAVAVTVLLWPEWRGRQGLALKVGSAFVAALLVLVFNVAAVATIRKVDVAFGKDSTVPSPGISYARQDAAGADTAQVRIAYNPMSYYLVKKAAWVAWRRQPVFGIGAGTFAVEADRAYQEGRLTEAYRRTAAHSTYFGRLAEAGLVGFVALVVAWFGIWRCTLAATRASGNDGRIAWACLAGFAGLLVNGVNVDIMHFRFLWLGLAAVRAIYSDGLGQTAPKWYAVPASDC
jgi:hypothetical protein